MIRVYVKDGPPEVMDISFGEYDYTHTSVRAPYLLNS